MIRIIEFLIALAMVAALFVVIGLFLPSERYVIESIETNRKMTIVYDTINNLRRFKDWNPLVLRDPSVKLALSGPASGVGARLDYRSSQPALGQGSWEITDSDEEKHSVTIALSDPARGKDKVITFRLEPSGKNDRNVKITQAYRVNYGFNLLGRYAGLYVGRSVGDEMKVGLARMANILTAIPNVDYRSPDSTLTGLQIVDIPAENLLLVNAGSVERTNESIQQSIKNNQEWIKRVMETNKLEAAGPLRIITTDFSTEYYLFEVAQPVRRKSASTPRPVSEEDAIEEESIDEAELDITIPENNPVSYVRTEPKRSARAAYSGHMAGLDLARNAVRAWATTQGEEMMERPYESWTGGVEAAFTQEGEYEVFWAIK